MSLEDTENSSYNEEREIAQDQNISPSSADGQKLQIADLEVKKEFSEIEEKSDFKQQEKTVESGYKVKSREISENEIDKKLHEEILEKLDIKEKKQEIQESSAQGKLQDEIHLNKIKDLEESQIKMQIEKVISQDFLKIQNLVNTGLINSVQGQNLKKQVLQKAFDSLVQTEKVKRNLSPASQQSKQVDISVNKNEIFEEFSKNNPDFFISDGRKEVLNYLKSSDVIIGKDELNKISGIIRAVEKAAIERYLQKTAHEKTLRDSNETAKQRLKANAQKSGLSGNLSRTFTREQIGKMSGVEFTKYESAIMEALKKGLIK